MPVRLSRRRASPRRSRRRPARPVVPSQSHHRNHRPAPGRIGDRSCVCVAGPPPPPPLPADGWRRTWIAALRSAAAAPEHSITHDPAASSRTALRAGAARACALAQRAYARQRSARAHTHTHTPTAVFPRARARTHTHTWLSSRADLSVRLGCLRAAGQPKGNPASSATSKSPQTSQSPSQSRSLDFPHKNARTHARTRARARTHTHTWLSSRVSPLPPEQTSHSTKWPARGFPEVAASGCGPSDGRGSQAFLSYSQ